MIYTVTMNPAIDYVLELGSSLEPGAVNRSRGETYQFGGKGINVSNMLRNLGMDTIALGFVAGETGCWLERALAAAGLNTRLLHLREGMTRVNIKIRTPPETEINGIGPVVTPEDLERLFALLEEPSAGDAVVLSGSVSAGMGPETYGRILSRLANRELLTVVDAAGKLLSEALPHRPFLVKPNRNELSALVGRNLETDKDLADAAAQVQIMGARNVMVSLAGDGALLLDEAGNLHRMACPQGSVINSVGAGDSMVAGFLAGWLQTRDYDAALAWGVAAGSATAFSLGLAEPGHVESLVRALLPKRTYEIVYTYLNGCSGAAHPLTEFDEAVLQDTDEYIRRRHGAHFECFTKVHLSGGRVVYTWDTGGVTYRYEFTQI